MDIVFVAGRLKADANPSSLRQFEEAVRRDGYKLRVLTLPYDELVDEWVDYLKGVYAEYDPQNTVLSGFSLGAVAAFLTAARRQPAKLVLCSLPAWCKERLHLTPEKARARFTPRQLEAFATHAFDPLAKSLTCPTTLLVGECEPESSPSLVRQMFAIHSLIQGSRLVVVPKVGHDFMTPTYIRAFLAEV